METTIVYRCNIGRMEKKMGTYYLGFRPWKGCKRLT